MKIAIDGPAAAGKTTLGKRLAHALGFLFVPTGAMYRAAALAHHRGLALEDMDITVGEDGRVFLNGEDVTNLLSNPELDELSSRLAADARVRARLVELQRRIAAGRDVVMEGRDIGTVVLPDAELKIFLWATLEERARRRQREQGGTFAEVLEAIRRRDERDSTRSCAPLRPAPDAVVLDTTGKDPDEVLKLVLKLVEERRARLAS
ncbi:MAG: (d)CMP kinase [Candidatus Bipolaricaulota bacterium]|nr:(d)CMP kinase [Candidatus Bipolaricaulota bacterium]MDW8126224.1 (d)CMP kinase [Candidatus Bipolaricaulota bacterium]